MKNRRISLLPLGVIIEVIFNVIAIIVNLQNNSVIWPIIFGVSGLVICIIAAELQEKLNRKWGNE